MKDRTFRDFRLLTRTSGPVTDLVPLSPQGLKSYLESASLQEQNFLAKEQFRALPDDQAFASNADRIYRTYIAVSDPFPDEGPKVKSTYDYNYLLSPWVNHLPTGIYSLSDKLDLKPREVERILFGWGLGAYAYEQCKTEKTPPKDIFLRIPPSTKIRVNTKRLHRELSANYLAQDLINTPENIMTCRRLTHEAQTLARRFGAKYDSIDGKNLESEFPLIDAVGKGSDEKPRLVDIHWGDPSHPHVTLVGKGVIFDDGGPSNIKDANSVLRMKYDMAGAAHALAAAYMIMDAKLPVRLRVLLPIVENRVGPKGYRVGEVYKGRLGKTIEIVNTDAEGRLILADTLVEASHPALHEDEKRPDLIYSCGSLTGYGHAEFPGWATAASNKPAVLAEFMRAAAECQEYFATRPYLRRLEHELKKNTVADLKQCVDDSHGRYDDLLALIFLGIHVENGWKKNNVPDFLHHDLQPWREPETNITLYPEGLPDGGFVHGPRSVVYMIEQRLKRGVWKQPRQNGNGNHHAPRAG